MEQCDLTANGVEQFLKEIATEQKKFASEVRNFDDLREIFGGILITIFDLRMYLEKDPRQIIRNLDDQEKKDLLSEISAWQTGIQLLKKFVCAPPSGTSQTSLAALRPSYSTPKPRMEDGTACLP